jgi:hypothetical protein
MTIDESVRKMEFFKDWFQKRADFSYDWNEPYLFWYEGSHSKYYRNEVDGPEPISYRISVYVTSESIEVEARLYDQSDVKKLKVLDSEGDRFKFEFVQEENLVPIIGYVQELDIKFEKYVKDYIIQYKLKNLEDDFKK